MANGDGDIVDGVIAGAREAVSATGCMAHGAVLTAIQANSTATQHTNRALGEVRTLAESTHSIVSGLDAKIESTKKFDFKDLLTWFRVLGAIAVFIILVMQALQSKDHAERQRALDVLLRMEGIDVTQLDKPLDPAARGLSGTSVKAQ